ESGDGAIDQARIQVGQQFVIDAQPLGDARSEFLDDDVSIAGEPQKNIASRFALEIKSEGAFVAGHRIGRCVTWARFFDLPGAGLRCPSSSRFAGLFDPDDVGAEIAENHGAVRSGRELGQVEKLYSS